MKRGQSTIEYVLLAAITVVALVVGSNFVAKIKTGGFEKHFQSANYRLNNPGSAIVGTQFSPSYLTDDSGSTGGGGRRTGTNTRPGGTNTGGGRTRTSGGTPSSHNTSHTSGGRR